MSAKARLLVASTALDDENFHRTVVFIIEHDHNGALGVVLNRPGDVDARRVVPPWADRLDDPARLHVGGPVADQSVIGLGLGPPEGVDGLSPVFAGIGVVDLHRAPEEVPHVAPVRLFAGYAGWAGGQLEAEMLQGSWFLVDARVDDVFTTDPEALWARVLRRQGGLTALAADAPEDTSMN